MNNRAFQDGQSRMSDHIIFLKCILIFFRVVDRLTPYSILKQLGFIRTYRHVEIWVILWSLTVVLSSYAIANHLVHPSIIYGICILGAIRILEIITTQCKIVFLIEDGSGRSPLSIRSLRRSIVLSMVNFVEIVLWFTVYHIVLVDYQALAIPNDHPNQYLLLLRESLIEMVGNSSGLVSALSTSGWFLLVVQPVIGFFMVSVVVGRFISFLPKPTSADQEEVE